MVETSGMAEIRGINIDKLAKGFAEQDFIFKPLLENTTTSARECRYYLETAGDLDSTDTTGMTTSRLKGMSQLALPEVVEQSWSRSTAYVKKYFVESPWLSYEDVKDSDIDILARNTHKLTRAIAQQVDIDCINAITQNYSPSTILTSAAVGTGWDDTTNGNPILDLLSGSAAIAGYHYNTAGLSSVMNQAEYKNLLNYIIAVKGSSIPTFASDTARSGTVMTIVGQKIVVTPNITAGYVLQVVPKTCGTWKSFTPITAQTKEEVGIGVKIRVWEEGVAFLTDPHAVHLISGCA